MYIWIIFATIIGILGVTGKLYTIFSNKYKKQEERKKAKTNVFVAICILFDSLFGILIPYNMKIMEYRNSFVNLVTIIVILATLDLIRSVRKLSK